MLQNYSLMFSSRETSYLQAKFPIFCCISSDWFILFSLSFPCCFMVFHRHMNSKHRQQSLLSATHVASHSVWQIFTQIQLMTRIEWKSLQGPFLSSRLKFGMWGARQGKCKTSIFQLLHHVMTHTIHEACFQMTWRSKTLRCVECCVHLLCSPVVFTSRLGCQMCQLSDDLNQSHATLLLCCLMWFWIPCASFLSHCSLHQNSNLQQSPAGARCIEEFSVIFLLVNTIGVWSPPWQISEMDENPLALPHFLLFWWECFAKVFVKDLPSQPACRITNTEVETQCAMAVSSMHETLVFVSIDALWTTKLSTGLPCFPCNWRKFCNSTFVFEECFVNNKKQHPISMFSMLGTH